MRLYRIAERRDKYGNTCKEWKLYKTIPELPRIEVFRARILIDAECRYCGPCTKGILYGCVMIQMLEIFIVARTVR